MPGLFSKMTMGARYVGQGVKSAYRHGGIGAVGKIGAIGLGAAGLTGAYGMTSGYMAGGALGMFPGGESPGEKGQRYGQYGAGAGLGIGALAGAVGGALLARRYFGMRMTRPFNRITALGGGRGVSGLLR